MSTTPKKSAFIHLHAHSHYSLLNALPKVDELIDEAKKYGMDAIALTDAGNLYGAIEFFKDCKKAGIKSIIGVDAYLAVRTRTEMQAGVDNRRHRCVLLAKNITGYNNLMKIVTDSYLEGFYYKPRIDHELLEKYHEGMICIASAGTSDIAQAVKMHNHDKARELIAYYKKVFARTGDGETGSDFYIEISRHPEIDGHETLMQDLIKIARETDTQIVAGQEIYYLHPEDKIARDTLMLVNTSGADAGAGGAGSGAGGTAGSAAMGGGEDEEDFSFRSPEQMEELFKDIPDAIENTRQIADMCNVTIELGKWVFPNYILASGRSYDDELDDLALKGLEIRGVSGKEAVDRMKYELKVIRDKGYAPYFLVVADLLKFAHENGILTNIRGSVAGSLVTYLTGITNINPLEYKLPFERFLNPERPSAPDIDMDYADNRRDEVIDYARRKYGANNVAQIGTFGTMMARGSVKDVARALGYPYEMGDRISKMIPMGAQGFPMTIERALAEVPELKKMYDDEEDPKRIIDLAKKIEGCARHISVHAAGVVISPRPLTDFTPLQYDTKGEKKIISQYDMYSIEDAGLLKFDFLGIKNLSILADAVDRVKKVKGIDVDIEQIPLDDKKTFEMLARGETIGLFQLNGSGLTRFLIELKPTTIHDINAMVALYRPGPLESIPQYIERKHDASKVRYLDPRMKDILDMSFGVITYQDDVMMIAIKLAGYSWLEADKLRKAMGKKIPKEMAEQKDKLLSGFVEKGMTDKKAQELWKLIEPFAAYGFNKCLTGDTLITDATTGARHTILELYKNNIQPSIHSMDDNYKLVSSPISAVMGNGVKKIFELKTQTGKIIRATDNHPFRTWDGWTELKDLVIGTHIATPRKIQIGDNEKTVATKNNALKATVLGYLISEGNLCHPSGVYFYSTRENEIGDFMHAATQFKNIKCTTNYSKSAISVYCGRIDQKKNNPIYEWIQSLGLIGKKATEKYIPQEVFMWASKDQAVFLGKLWQGDGCISINNEQLYYATSSSLLARDVAHLLLRFGIISTIHTKHFKYRGGYKAGYTVNVTHRTNIKLFQEKIGIYLIGNKAADLTTLVATTDHLDGIAARGTKDIVPKAVLSLIRNEMKMATIGIAELSKNTNLAPRLFSEDTRKIGYSREVVLKIADSLDSPVLRTQAENDIYWDAIVSIVPAGEEMTYDLTVNPHHNFVANDIIVHNSHAASYGRVAYQTSYMKANYPALYMSAALTADSGDVEKIAEIINECKRMKIPILPPDINESFSQFTVIVADENNPVDRIRFGLVTIKNFGQGIATAIIDERTKNGPFTSLVDFLDRIKDRNLNKKSLEALIKVGAMDSFGIDRGVMLGNIETLLAHNKEHEKRPENQDSLFGLMTDTSTIPTLKLADIPPALPIEKLTWERELLGLYLSGHPLDRYRDVIDKQKTNIAAIKATEDKKEEEAPVKPAVKEPYKPYIRGQQTTKPEDVIVFAAIVEDVRLIMTKKNEPMLFVRLADFTGSIEAVVFPRVYVELKNMFVPETCLAIKGKISERNGEKSVIIDRAKRLT